MFFIFNKREQDTPDILEQRISKLKYTLNNSEELKNSKIFVLNLLKAVEFVTSSSSTIQEAKKESGFEDDEILEQFLSVVLEHISMKMKAMIFQFAHSFYQLLHSYFILLSKIISLKMKLPISKRPKKDAPSSSFRLFRSTLDSDDVTIKLKELSKEVDGLLTDAEKQIEKYKVQLRDLYLKVLEDVDLELRSIAKNHTTVKPYEENGKSWFRNVIEGLQTQEASPFEEEINRVIVNHFSSKFSLVS